MKLITRDTDYALRALCYIGKRNHEFTCVSELVSALKIPRPFLRKILQILHNAGLLVSHKGKGGGFALAKKPQQIFLTDLMGAFQGKFCINECYFKKTICFHTRRCKVRKTIKKIERYAFDELKSISIAGLIE